MINTCCNLYFYYNFIVHGGIRHLETESSVIYSSQQVHGGIRHLETSVMLLALHIAVHGGIRHLEMFNSFWLFGPTSSWRHTPFRNV